MHRSRIGKVAGALLMGFGLQLFCGLRLYATPADLRAAGAERGWDFIVFDVPGSVGTSANAINPEARLTASCGPATVASLRLIPWAAQPASTRPASTRRGRSRDPTATSITWILTASCVPPTVALPRSMSRIQ